MGRLDAGNVVNLYISMGYFGPLRKLLTLIVTLFIGIINLDDSFNDYLRVVIIGYCVIIKHLSWKITSSGSNESKDTWCWLEMETVFVALFNITYNTVYVLKKIINHPNELKLAF